MAAVTYYVALPFVMDDDGPEPREAMECTSANAAIMRAEILSRKEGNIGTVALSRMGDPASGEFSDAAVLRTFGQVPTDFAAL
jgi:hypothetical protein